MVGARVRLAGADAGGNGDRGIAAAATRRPAEVLAQLDVDPASGLTAAQVGERRRRWGPNAVISHRARALSVLWHQLRSPLLLLLLAAVLISYLVGERGSAAIITVIVALSVGLGFGNEYRAERAAQALHSQLRHEAAVTRDGAAATVDVTDLVPGDVVRLRLGDVVPADLRLLAGDGLECDESALTGESVPVAKGTATVPPGTPLAELTGCALMGTVVTAGSGRGVVVTTGSRTEFGAIAGGLAGHPLQTQFQVGLRRFSLLLVWVAAALTGGILVINLVLAKPVLDAVLFSLAIAVGITPQLLPAVVASSLAAGSRQLTRRKVLVKRLVCIEDLGDAEVLLTDKTGTLTLGGLTFVRAVPLAGDDPDVVLRWAVLCTDDPAAGGQALGANALDRALREAATGVVSSTDVYRRLGQLPFDHERRLSSVLVQAPNSATVLVTKGAPEAVLERCRAVPVTAADMLSAEFAAGNRVLAVATRPFPPERPLTQQDERELQLVGLLVFRDPPKPGAAQSLQRLAALGLEVKVVTGDNAAVAVKVCHDLGLPVRGVLTGTDVAASDDDTLAERVAHATVFARVSPQDKARIVQAHRRPPDGRHEGRGVAFLGDGVNDALALHSADVGISVDSATDVAKDAADVILLEKDLDVLADGVGEGRRIFANTVKYVLMGTSSNFGNMFSAAAASAFLPFLPMLPSQLLLGNLLYDSSQLAIPSDRVDEEQLRRPSHWDIRFIRRFMLVFGPLSSIFDFATFAVLLRVFHSGPELFRSGWFVESLATQTLIVFAIRTRRVPFFASRPSLPLVGAALTVVAVAAVLPLSPAAGPLGFTALPPGYYAMLAALVLGYLVLIEVGKRVFYARIVPLPGPAAAARPLSQPRSARHRLVAGRAAYFASAGRRTRSAAGGPPGPPAEPGLVGLDHQRRQQ